MQLPANDGAPVLDQIRHDKGLCAPQIYQYVPALHCQRQIEPFTPPVQLSEEFNVAVVITNHVVSDPSGGAVFVADPKKPVGGHVLAHACTVRLSLRKGKGEQRLVKVVDAPNLRELHSFKFSA